ncbi:NUDIX hydrolase [Nocardia sp. CA-107356]|uniref:NUDIX hydrolase n=1 Tax=Nocardia sp. CA-107356 TaxID=3239972 RepID=UPI003D93935F
MSASSLHASATALLESWRPPTDSDASLREAMLAFLGSAPRGCLREHAPGHITASAVVLSHDEREVLLTLHPRVGRWIQLGGHCEEGDETVAAAALREATEESGITGLRMDPELYGAQAHPITCSLGAPTRHLDLLFRIVAPAGAVPIRSHESTDLRWWPVGALPDSADVLLR